MGWFRKTPEQIEIGNWYVGWPSWKFEITYNYGGFIHENHYIDISLLDGIQDSFCLGSLRTQIIYMIQKSMEYLFITMQYSFIGDMN